MLQNMFFKGTRALTGQHTLRKSQLDVKVELFLNTRFCKRRLIEQQHGVSDSVVEARPSARVSSVAGGLDRTASAQMPAVSNLGFKPKFYFWTVYAKRDGKERACAAVCLDRTGSRTGVRAEVNSRHRLPAPCDVAWVSLFPGGAFYKIRRGEKRRGRTVSRGKRVASMSGRCTCANRHRPCTLGRNMS